MNRRDAIAALVSLPEITRIAAAPVQPGDVIVIECDTYISQETAERIKAMVLEVWPGRKAIVLDKHLRLKVMGT